MRNALRAIIFHEGECARADDPDNTTPCECAVCIAKAALEGEEEWRFVGYHPERRRSLPRELAIHAAWKRYFTRVASQANGTSAPLDSILAKILGVASANDVTERDWFVATTIVQWLATNVGQCVLFDAGYEYEQPAASTTKKVTK